jgi:hypothetical protein
MAPVLEGDDAVFAFEKEKSDPRNVRVPPPDVTIDEDGGFHVSGG